MLKIIYFKNELNKALYACEKLRRLRGIETRSRLCIAIIVESIKLWLMDFTFFHARKTSSNCYNGLFYHPIIDYFFIKKISIICLRPLLISTLELKLDTCYEAKIILWVRDCALLSLLFVSFGRRLALWRHLVRD